MRKGSCQCCHEAHRVFYTLSSRRENIPCYYSERESASVSLAPSPTSHPKSRTEHTQAKTHADSETGNPLSMYSQRKEGFQVTHDLARGSGAAARKQMPLGSQDQVSQPRPLDSQLLSSPSISNWLSRDVSWLTVYTTSLSPLNRAKARTCASVTGE